MMIIYRFWNWLQNYRRDKTGSILVIFALVLVILIGVAGLTVDFSRKISAQNLLLAALDAAALAAANSKDKSPGARQAIALAIFEANLRNTVLGNFSIKPNINVKDKDNNVLVASASLELPTTLLAIVGIKKMDIRAEAEVNLAGVSNIEIVMVLDYSASMLRDGRVTVMTRVAKKFVLEMSGSKDGNSAVKFGMVPFSGAVLVTLPSYALVGEGSSDRPQRVCVEDRGYPYNINGEPVDSSTASKWYHGTKVCEYYEKYRMDIVPLTSDPKEILKKLSMMQPLEYTDIAAGMAIGYDLLTPNSIFGKAEPFDGNSHKFLILMTDGQQQKSKELGWTKSPTTVPQAEANLVSLCALARSKGMKVVTIAFMLSHAATVRRLRNCASDPSLAFDVKSADAMSRAFEAIMRSVQKQSYLSK